MAALKELPSRTQITRHDCVEGWRVIGKWAGIPLGELMHEVHLMPTAKFAMFHCADVGDEGVFYYKSIALADCYPRKRFCWLNSMASITERAMTPPGVSAGRPPIEFMPPAEYTAIE